MSEPVIFVHLSKTAGTTLTWILRAEYERVHVVDGHHLEGAPARARQAEAVGARAFAGHMPYGLDRLLEGEYRYITLLRDPVERIVSHYHAVLRHRDSPLWEELVSGRMGIREYVSEHSAGSLFNNGQTRLLGGSWAELERPADRETLEAAKANLDAFTGVGLTERFDDSLAVMRARLGWRTTAYDRRNLARRAFRAADLDAGTRSAIEERNSLDRELHRWAAERLERDLAAEVAPA